MNILRATAEAEPTAPAAQRAWLRAALAWLAFVPPEAAPLAIVDLLVRRGRRFRPRPARYRHQRGDRGPDGGGMAATSPPRLGGEYSSVRVMSDAARPRRLLGGPGASIGWTGRRKPPPTYVRPRVRLVRLVEAALAALCPAIADLERGVLLVDTNNGLDIPATRDEALSLALRTRRAGTGLRAPRRSPSIPAPG